MGFFVSDTVGLILAFLNTLTVLLLLYMVLQLVDVPESKVKQALDRIFSPVLRPLRMLLRRPRFDLSPLVAAALLQLIAAAVRKNWL
jgi:uncharacterized protein YggT (Ycf19 family)